MVVVSHTGSLGLLIFVIYLEKGKFYEDQNFWNACVYMWAYNIHPEIYSKLNLKKKLICNRHIGWMVFLTNEKWASDQSQVEGEMLNDQ